MSKQRNQYEVGSRHFLLWDDGVQYPVTVLSVDTANPNHAGPERQIRYDGYGTTETVHISRLLPFTPKRMRTFREYWKKQSVQCTKNEDTTTTTTTTEPVHQSFELGSKHFIRWKDGADYPVTLLALKDNGKSKIKFDRYSTTCHVDTNKLLPCTEERTSKFQVLWDERQQRLQKQKRSGYSVTMKSPVASRTKRNETRSKKGNSVVPQDR